MRLNGWQRLWVVISLLWMGVVAAYTLTRGASQSEIYHSWANDLLGYLVTEASDLKSYSVTSLRSTYSDLSDKELIEALHKKYIGKHPAYRYGFEQIDAKYERKIAGEDSNPLISVLIAVVLPVLLYVLGWTFVWVRNGFKNA